MRTDILTITLNPTVDFATSAPKVVPETEAALRRAADRPGRRRHQRRSRAIRLLGGQATALCRDRRGDGGASAPASGPRGRADWWHSRGPGETRQSMSVIDLSLNEQFRFVTPGPSWHQDDVDRGLRSIDAAAGRRHPRSCCRAASLRGSRRTSRLILADHVSDRGAQLIVDTSDPALFHLRSRVRGGRSPSCAWTGRRPRKTRGPRPAEPQGHGRFCRRPRPQRAWRGS